MASEKITEAMNLGRWFDRTCDDAFETLAGLHLQRMNHGVRSFADGYNEYPRVRLELVQILADPQDSALTDDLPLKSTLNAGFSQSVIKQTSSHSAHFSSKVLPAGFTRRHERGIIEGDFVR